MFKKFMESIQTEENSDLIKYIMEAYDVIDPDMEHVVDEFYYIPKSGKYYDKNSDYFVEHDVVESRLNMHHNQQKVNDTVLSMLFQDGVINAREYMQLKGRVNPDLFELTRKRKMEKPLSEYYFDAKKEINS